MIAELGSLTSSFKAMSDVTRAALSLRDAEAIRSKVIELQSLIMKAQTDAMSAQTASFQAEAVNRELRDQIAKFESWSSEKVRYALTDFGSETYAMALKREQANGEPSHLLCVNCFDQGQKSVLQFENMTAFRQRYYSCRRCRTHVSLGTPQADDWNTVVRHGEW